MNRHFKKRVFDIIQIGTRVDIPSRIFDYMIFVAIVVSIGVTFAATFESMRSYMHVLNIIELVTIIIFIIEYLLRLWTSDLLYPDKNKLVSLGKFVLSFYGIVDLMTIVSYFAPLYSNGIVAFRLIRGIRILRLFRLNQSSDTFSIMAQVILEKKKQLLSSILLIAMIMLAASLCMYGFEHGEQPEVFENAFSGIWWAMSTVLTVGYGDIYPITVGGKIIAIVIALLGVCVVAIPTGVISAGFVEYNARLREDGSGLKEETMEIVKAHAKKRKMTDDEYILYLLHKDKN